LTVVDLLEKKRQGAKLAMLTAYDYPTALIVDRAGVDLVLVGDSLGMVVLGYETTLPVTVDDMVHHARAVMRGCRRALVVVDMPFLSYHAGTDRAVLNAGRIIQESGAQAVKVEGGAEVTPVIRALRVAGIPVMGHLGLTPQSVHALGGYRVQGQDLPSARRLLEDAARLEAAGAFAVVLEAVPAELAVMVTARLSIPTIGIGAGPGCDGQVLVTHDLLGLFDRFTPKFVRRYAELGALAEAAARTFVSDVASGAFPAAEHAHRLAPAVLAQLREV
jgi:3-methyl-2-oxobutanoate hydroxymethyltransferase